MSLAKLVCFSFCCLVSLGGNFISVSAGEGPESLKYMMEVYPPANYVENDKLKGASVDILRLMWGKLGYTKPRITVLPWTRAYYLVKNKPKHVLFSMSRSDEREKLFKWVGPIFTARHVLIARSDFSEKISSLDDVKKYKIGVVRGDVAVQSLLGEGFNKGALSNVTTIWQNYKKLYSGHLNLICQSEASMKQFMRNGDFPAGSFKVVYVVDEKQNYYAFHKDTPDYIIEEYQTTFESISVERKEILKRYNLMQ